MRERAAIPPDGLERTRPREVRLTRSGRALVVLAAAFWKAALVAGVGLYLVSTRQAAAERRFEAQAVEGAGVVTRLWRGGGESKPPMVAYRLDVDGRSYSGQGRLSLRAWRSLAPGAAIALRYLPSDPSVNRLAGGGRGPMPAFVAYLTGGSLALIAGCVLLPLRSQRRLLSEGRPAPARVTKHQKVQHGTVFEFEFTTLGGTRVKGKGGPSAKPPAVGSPVWVLYDPDHPRTSAVYPFSLVTPRNTRSLSARRAS